MTCLSPWKPCGTPAWTRRPSSGTTRPSTGATSTWSWSGRPGTTSRVAPSFCAGRAGSRTLRCLPILPAAWPRTRTRPTCGFSPRKASRRSRRSGSSQGIHPPTVPTRLSILVGNGLSSNPMSTGLGATRCSWSPRSRPQLRRRNGPLKVSPPWSSRTFRWLSAVLSCLSWCSAGKSRTLSLARRR